MAARKTPRLPPPPPRQGPRPLPLHLMAHVSTLMASLAALPSLRHGSPPWKPHLAAAEAELRQSLAAAGPDAFERFTRAVMAEAASRHRAFLAGIVAYCRHPYRASPPAAREVWRQGTTRLLDYGGDGEPVLVVPSLVNRARVLDLLPEKSVMRHLAASGQAAFLVDWDFPGPEETGFTLTDYVAVRLEAAFDAVVARTGRRPALIGYCMGGLLALALAQRRAAEVRGLVLLATPWNFHAGREAEARLLAALAEPFGAAVAIMGALPVDLLQALFMALDPTLGPRKYIAFGGLDPASARAREFVALEDWANDGVPLAGPVARECLFGWYGANDPFEGRWRIDGTPVRPETITVPTLAVVPLRDRIVPPESALPLVERIPNCQLISARGGHVGMLLTQHAASEVLEPISAWLLRSGGV